MALTPGATHMLQWMLTKGSNTARWSESQKCILSSDCSLQLDYMKSESVVIADQQAAVNTFSGLVHTARQANKVGGGRRATFVELSRIQRWGLSRNKVSLAEAGDGSPPFYFIIGIIEKPPRAI